MKYRLGDLELYNETVDDLHFIHIFYFPTMQLNFYDEPNNFINALTDTTFQITSCKELLNWD